MAGKVVIKNGKPRKPRGEDDRHVAAFQFWYKSSRKIAPVLLEFAVPARTLYDWMERYDWHERADKLDAEARKLADKKLVSAKAQLLIDHQKAGQALRLKGISALTANSFNFRDERNVIGAIAKGIDIERKAHGIADGVDVELTGDVNVVHDINEIALLAAIKRLRKNAEREAEEDEDGD